MAGVRFEHVVKRFGSVPAVNDFTLDIPDKEFLVLVGPSGCGKSTVLRLLAGLEEISDGAIYIGERQVNNVAAKDRDIAMVFQSYALYPHMSVYNNMAFGLTLRGMPKPEIQRRVQEAAEMLGIQLLLARKPRQLSGGQRQRVALGRAIVREPAVFLLDEPLSNLDAQLRLQTRAELSKLHRRLGTTFIYVTHDQTEAMTMATRIVVMREGIIQQVGTPQELYSHPANIFVAGFIGSPSMNFLHATVEAQGEGLAFAIHSELRLPAPPAWTRQLQPYQGKEIVLGIRPEDIYTAQTAPPDVASVACTAKVDIVEALGNETLLYLLSGDLSFLARVDPRVEARPGDELSVALNTSRMHLFDPATERRIVEET